MEFVKLLHIFLGISPLLYNPSFYYRILLLSVGVTSLWYHLAWNNPTYNRGFFSFPKILGAVLFAWWWCILPTHVYSWTLLDAWADNIDGLSTPMYEIVHDPRESTTIDVFAIHGLGSNPYNAWRYRENNTDVFWLKDILPKEKGCSNLRITMLNHHTTWHNDVPTFDIKDHARRLLSQVEDINQGERPIVFLAHSFGGLLLKQALDLAISESLPVAMRTRGILFLGVPHYGTKASFWASLLSCTAYWRGSSTSLLEVMVENSPTLERLDQNFNRFYNNPQSTFFSAQPYIRDFVEGKFERFGQFSIGLTVDYVLGKYRYAKDPIKLERDHRGLNKFRSSTDSEFRLFFRYFQEALSYAQVYPIATKR